MMSHSPLHWQDPSCLLQIQPGRYGEASGSPTCASSASWTQQLFVEPRPAYPRFGGHLTEAALRGNFALMSFTQIPRLPNTPPVSALIYGLEDSGWQLNANLTALAPQSTTINWGQAGLSAANIAILYQVQPSPLDVYSFAYDGMSWAFVNHCGMPEAGGKLDAIHAAGPGCGLRISNFPVAGHELVPDTECQPHKPRDRPDTKFFESR